MYGGDIRELRMKYLADFAHLLHITPNEVDRLRIGDFAHLVLWIEAYHKANAPKS